MSSVVAFVVDSLLSGLVLPDFAEQAVIGTSIASEVISAIVLFIVVPFQDDSG